MTMAKTAPCGSDVSAGTFECVDCGERIQMASHSSLPPCPNADGNHSQNAWQPVSGRGDAEEDPYPDRKLR